jgi:hypothetical protein
MNWHTGYGLEHDQTWFTELPTYALCWEIISVSRENKPASVLISK